MMIYNLGLASFLDTLAGIRSDELNLVLKSKRFIKTRMSVPVSFVKSGIQNKVSKLTDESQIKLQDTIQKVVNDSNGGLVCIII